jgi:hypothetical protein
MALDKLAQLFGIQNPTIEDLYNQPDPIKRALNVGKTYRIPDGVGNRVINYATIKLEEIKAAKEKEKAEGDKKKTGIMGKISGLKDRLFGKKTSNLSTQSVSPQGEAPVAPSTIPTPINETEVEGTEQKPAKVSKITVYNPKKEQTDDTPHTGGMMTKMEWGDIALANKYEYEPAREKYFKEKKDTFVVVPELSHVKTPYGNGVFRVRDTMNRRYDNDGDNKIDIFVPEDDKIREQLIRKTPVGSYYLIEQ